MKSSSSMGMKILTAALCVGVLGYFGIQAYRYFTNPLTTSPAYTYQVEQSVTVTGWVVREEQVIPSPDSGVLRLSRTEGEKVSRGGQVAVVYADQASLDKQTELETVEARIEQLEYARQSAMNSEAVLRLDNQIMSGILELRTAVAAGRMDTADETLSELRSYVLKRDYSYSGGEDLDGQLKELQARLRSLQKQTAASKKTVKAPVSGLYSAVVDGYEGVLTPAKAAAMTPSDIRGLKKDAAVTSRVGKLITGENWYFLTSVPVTSLGKMATGQTVTLRFATGTSSDLTMQVESIGPEEDGQAAVLLSSRENQAKITLLRQQSADIVWNTVEGVRVPAASIRVDEEGRTGVYCVVGMNARFKPVEVIHTGTEGYALVLPTSTIERTKLRPGDTVIVTAYGLYDGKVVG